MTNESTFLERLIIIIIVIALILFRLLLIVLQVLEWREFHQNVMP